MGAGFSCEDFLGLQQFLSFRMKGPLHISTGPDLGRYTANDKEDKPDYVAILLSLEPLIFFMFFPIGQVFVPAELKDWIILCAIVSDAYTPVRPQFVTIPGSDTVDHANLPQLLRMCPLVQPLPVQCFLYNSQLNSTLRLQATEALSTVVMSTNQSIPTLVYVIYDYAIF